MTVLIDSDVVIEVLRGRDSDLLAQWIALSDSSATLLVSPITVAEIEAGARETEKQSIERFFSSVVCVAIDDRIGKLAGTYLRQYGKSHNVEIADALIAASASWCGAALWTRNRKHYPMPELTFHS